MAKLENEKGDMSDTDLDLFDKTVAMLRHRLVQTGREGQPLHYLFISRDAAFCLLKAINNLLGAVDMLQHEIGVLTNKKRELLSQVIEGDIVSTGLAMRKLELTENRLANARTVIQFYAGAWDHKYDGKPDAALINDGGKLAKAFLTQALKPMTILEIDAPHPVEEESRDGTMDMLMDQFRTALDDQTDKVNKGDGLQELADLVDAHKQGAVAMSDEEAVQSALEFYDMHPVEPTQEQIDMMRSVDPSGHISEPMAPPPDGVLVREDEEPVLVHSQDGINWERFDHDAPPVKVEEKADWQVPADAVPFEDLPRDDETPRKVD